MIIIGLVYTISLFLCLCLGYKLNSREWIVIGMIPIVNVAAVICILVYAIIWCVKFKGK